MNYLDIQEAADYLGLPASYIRHQIKHHGGPAFIAPSPKKKFFRVVDLDAWRATWQWHAPKVNAISVSA